MGLSADLFNLLFGRAKSQALFRPGSESLEDWVFAGNYRVLNKMGMGGTACVLRASDLALKREVALKVLLETETTDEELTQRFLTEGRILASLRHPNVVLVYSLGVDERLKFPFLVMEMVHGATLDDHLEEFRTNPLLLYREMITILEAINFCHQKQIVHLDLKPSNIMIDQTGQIKIIDFGIAVPITFQKVSPFALGTAYYMAPEQFIGNRRLTPETDIYSLGIILWELLTGKAPFQPKTKSSDPFNDLEIAHQTLPPPLEQILTLPHAVPLAPIIEKMLAKNPADRPSIPQIVFCLNQELINLGGRIGDRYEVIRTIDRTGSTHLLKARDRAAQRVVTIERLAPEFSHSPEKIDRFTSRSQALSKLQPTVMPATFSLEREEKTNLPYLVREHLSGQPLGELAPMFQADPVRLTKLMLELFTGLVACHDAGFGHGNLSLRTILVDRHDHVKIPDCDLLQETGEAIARDLASAGPLLTTVFQPMIEAHSLAPVLPGSLQELKQAMARWSGTGAISNTAPAAPAPADLRPLCQDLADLLVRFETDDSLVPAGPRALLGTTIQEKLANITRIDEEGKSSGIKVLLGALEEEKDPMVVAAILPVMAHLERRTELPVILTYLNHPDPRVRVAAVEAIRIFGEVGVCLQLFGLLRDPDIRVRKRTSAALKGFGDERVREQLQNFALFGLPDQQVKAVHALSLFPSEEHLSLLDLLSRSGTPEVAAAARETVLAFLTGGLSESGVGEAAEPLTQARIESLQDHAIICGYGRKGQLLLNDLLKAGQPAVVIESDPRESGLELVKAQGIPTLTGSATHAARLLGAGVTKARYVFAVTQDDDANIEIALKAKMLLGNVHRSPYLAPLQCITHVFSHSLQCMAGLFRPRRPDPRSRFEGLTASPGFELRLFNIYESAARQILTQYPPPLRALQEQVGGRPLHLLLIGFSNLGVRLAAHAAAMLQGTDPDLLQITIVDSPMSFKKAAFRLHYPRIDRVVSLNLVPIPPNEITPAAIDRLAALEPFSAAYICHEEWTLGRRLARLVRDLPGLAPSVPVVYLQEFRNDQDGRIHIPESGCAMFPLYSSTCSLTTILEEPLDVMARAIHRQYDESQRRLGIKAGTDPRRAQWERLRWEVKEQFRFQADHLRIKLRSVGCEMVLATDKPPTHDLTREELQVIARMEHRLQVVESILASPDNRRRSDQPGQPGPLETPWSFLSDREKEEIEERVRCIPRILEMVNMRIHRCP